MAKLSGEVFLCSDEFGDYVAKIISCVVNDELVKIDFRGVADGEAFQGNCFMKRESDDSLSGTGFFKQAYGAEEGLSSTVKAQLSEEKPGYSIQGIWTENGVDYELECEISLA